MHSRFKHELCCSTAYVFVRFLFFLLSQVLAATRLSSERLWLARQDPNDIDAFPSAIFLDHHVRELQWMPDVVVEEFVLNLQNYPLPRFPYTAGQLGSFVMAYVEYKTLTFCLVFFEPDLTDSASPTSVVESVQIPPLPDAVLLPSVSSFADEAAFNGPFSVSSSSE